MRERAVEHTSQRTHRERLIESQRVRSGAVHAAAAAAAAVEFEVIHPLEISRALRSPQRRLQTLFVLSRAEIGTSGKLPQTRTEARHPRAVRRDVDWIRRPGAPPRLPLYSFTRDLTLDSDVK